MMKNVKALAIAAALVAAGAAQATITTGQNAGGKDGSLFLWAYSPSTPDSTLMVDLGYKFTDLAAYNTANGMDADWLTPGAQVVWNFNTNTVTSNIAGTTTPTGNAWSAEVADWLATDVAGATDIIWGVVAGGATSTTNSSIVSTAAQGVTPAALRTGMATALANIYTSAQTHAVNSPTHINNENGASSSADIDANAANVGSYWGTGVNFASAVQFNAGTQLGQSAKFWYGRTGSATQAAWAQYTDAEFFFNTQTGTLTYAVAVPEASTYAMLAAGLGLVGMVARRRKAA